MPQKYNSDKPDLGDWPDWIANGTTAIILGVISGILFGLQIERVGILWGCVIWILVFAVIGFRKQIRYFVFRYILDK